MTRRALFAALVLLLVLAGLGLWWWRVPTVPAVAVQAMPLVQTLQFSARMATLSRVDLGSTVTGRVAQVLVAEGSTVREGEALVRLEDAELQSALAQAQASEQQASARLVGLRSTGRRGAQAAVAQVESVRVAAQADLERTQDLVGRGFVSTARLDEARRALGVAQAQLDAAKAQNSAASEQGSDVAQAQAQLALAAAATRAARARLAQAVIVAPAPARVLARSVEPGQIVQPGRTLLTLALAGPRQLVAAVDERYLRQLLPGQVAAVKADAFPDQPFSAKVLSLSPLVDAQRGAVEVKFALAQPPDFLREDMTLSIEVETARRERALVVPLAALRGDGTALWLVQDGRVLSRPVQLGLRTLESAEVLQGLAAGDTVLLGPAPEPGSRVRVDFSSAAPRAAGARADDPGSALSNAMGR